MSRKPLNPVQGTEPRPTSLTHPSSCGLGGREGRRSELAPLTRVLVTTSRREHATKTHPFARHASIVAIGVMIIVTIVIVAMATKHNHRPHRGRHRQRHVHHQHHNHHHHHHHHHHYCHGCKLNISVLLITHINFLTIICNSTPMVQMWCLQQTEEPMRPACRIELTHLHAVRSARLTLARPSISSDRFNHPPQHLPIMLEVLMKGIPHLSESARSTMSQDS